MSNTLTHYTTDTIKNPILIAEHFSKSGYFKDTADVSKAVVKIIAGQELGFGPMASISGFHIVQGKPTLSANLMAAAIKRSGRYNYRVTKMSPDECNIKFFENGEECGESSFTIEEAKIAGTQNLQKFARNMLFARALSNGARWYCPDVLNGAPIYTPEELGATVNGDGDIVEVEAEDTTPPPTISEKDTKEYYALINEYAKLCSKKTDEIIEVIKTQYGFDSHKMLPVDKFHYVIKSLRVWINTKKEETKPPALVESIPVEVEPAIEPISESVTVESEQPFADEIKDAMIEDLENLANSQYGKEVNAYYDSILKNNNVKSLTELPAEVITKQIELLSSTTSKSKTK
jgi:hypothetical protein